MIEPENWIYKEKRAGNTLDNIICEDCNKQVIIPFTTTPHGWLELNWTEHKKECAAARSASSAPLYRDRRGGGGASGWNKKDGGAKSRRGGGN